MSQEFSRVKVSTNKRSSFDMSHQQVTSTDFGKIIPIALRECIPGDEVKINPRVFIRLAPLSSPTFGKIKARVHTFFVPNRVVWPLWDRWITKQTDSSLPYLTTLQLYNEAQYDPAFKGYITTETPYISGAVCDLFTNLGLSQDAIDKYHTSDYNYKLSPFPFLAYQRIWFDYFRDSNIDTNEAFFDALKAHTYGQYNNTLVHQMCLLRRCCYKKDYFTTAKLNPQDGSTGASATAQRLSSLPSGSEASTGGVVWKRDANSNVVSEVLSSASTTTISTSVQIAAIRAANSLQRYLERNNYVGARAISRLLAHFGVAPSAERLDMSEYIGGYDFPVQIADVTSTSLYSTASTISPFDVSGLGTQAGKGIAASNNQNGVSYKVKEHGILMSLLTIVPDTGYYQGMSKLWQRGYNGDGQFEFFTPEFENLGFQPILRKELVSDIDTNPDTIFGYTPRYSDYKFQMDVLGGSFQGRQTSTGSDRFHLFRKIASDVSLNSAFTAINGTDSNQYDRIFQVTGNGLDHFFVNVDCNCTMIRPMSSFVAPSIEASEEGDGVRVELPYGGIRI